MSETRTDEQAAWREHLGQIASAQYYHARIANPELAWQCIGRASRERYMAMGEAIEAEVMAKHLPRQQGYRNALRFIQSISSEECPDIVAIRKAASAALQPAEEA